MEATRKLVRKNGLWQLDLQAFAAIPAGQPGKSGPSANVEYMDFEAKYIPTATGTLAQGQAFCRDSTQLSGYWSTSNYAPTANIPADGGQGDIVVLPSSANAGDPYGVYQGPAIAVTSGVGVILMLRRKGIGIVQVQVGSAGTKIDVGDGLIVTQGTTANPIVGSRAVGDSIGRATATVISGALVSTVGSTLVAVPGSGTTVAAILADINCL